MAEITRGVTTTEAVVGVPFSEACHLLGAETILLVEDEAFVRKVTGEVLESAGYRLVIAASAGEALEVQRRCPKPVDLLLSDVVLPGKSGHELAYEFEGVCPGAQILLMSGYEEQLALCKLSSNGRLYLAKPFTTHTLLRRVREVLNKNPVPLGARLSSHSF